MKIDRSVSTKRGAAQKLTKAKQIDLERDDLDALSASHKHACGKLTHRGPILIYTPIFWPYLDAAEEVR